ncbi:hypothetical protein ACFLTH_13485 [Bacteroidota bacterium]
MSEDVFSIVKDWMSKNLSPDHIKTHLAKKGFLESDIEAAIDRAASELRVVKHDLKKRLVKSFVWKEILDRIGYGFVSHPFLNILFMLSGGSFFLIGLINGLRTVMSLLYGSFLREFSKVHGISKSFISRSGILYGFSFLVLSFAVVIRSPILYAVAFLAGSLGVVAHGEVYTNFLRNSLKREHMGAFLSRISSFGIIITVLSLLASGYLMDMFPLLGREVTLSLLGNNYNLKIYGYLISFEITALVFIISGHIISRVKQQTIEKQKSMILFIGEYITKITIHSKFFTNKKVTALLTFSTIITALVQVLGNSFYGIFIFNYFKEEFLGGFFNVAVIFSIAVVFSFIGPWFTKNLRHHIGISPMLVFGTLLSAMLPLSLAYNPNLYVVGVATALSIIGASILGMAQGFFTRKLLSESERELYFSFIGAAVALPLLILVPIGAYIGQLYGLALLFKILIFTLVFVATPIFFFMVLMYERTLEKTF